MILPSISHDLHYGGPMKQMGFPSSSAGKESGCNAGHLGSVPGLGRSPGEGIGYPLQCSWASLMAQIVKNPPAMQETWLQSLGWEDPLEKGMATHSRNSCLEISMDREVWQATVHGVAMSQVTEQVKHTHIYLFTIYLCCLIISTLHIL